MIKVGIISTFPPTQCGIATYASDLISSHLGISGDIKFVQFELLQGNTQSGNSTYSINCNNSLSYKSLADFINDSGIDVLDLQHEFKIFGHPDGENVEIILDRVKIPIVTTLHTVNQNLTPERERVFRKVLDRSASLFVFSDESKLLLREKYKMPESKVNVIPHGVPVIDFILPQDSVLRKKYTQNLIFVSSGLMRETKGYEIAIEALNSLKSEIPEFHYIIVGSNHPQNKSSVIYREKLKNLVNAYNLNDNITFIDKYLSQTELIQLIQSADVCLLPYTREEQSSSGVLALMIACGRPVIATPFHFAKSLVTEKSGVVAEAFLPGDYANSLRALMQKMHLVTDIMNYNHSLGQSWNWSTLAKQYLKIYKTLLLL